MPEYYAHTGSDLDDVSTWQTLSEHANEVARLAEAFAEKFGMGVWGRTLGLLHDAGKASVGFRRRLEGGKPVDHSTAGAKVAVGRYGVCGQFMAYALCGHHGGMPNGKIWSNPPSSNSKLLRSPLKDRLGGEIESYNAFFELVEAGQINLPDAARLGAPMHPGRTFESTARKAFSMFVLEHFLYSSLVDGDYLDTERFMTPEASEAREARELANMEELLAKLESHMAELMEKAGDTSVNRARRSVYEDCLATAVQPSGLYTMTVPTGGGKTLSSMAFGLRHAVEQGMERVIVAIPYTSIVEQTAATLKAIFGAENVLEHHSNYDFRDLDDEEKARQRLAIQNWDAPIVVTTNVQLFESLFSNKPGKSCKVHNMARSVIILDEAQTLPDELLKPSLAMLEELAAGYGSSMVLCTATQPALEGLWPFGAEPREIVQHRDLFDEAFGGRVAYESLGTIEQADLVERIAAGREVLCVVGTRGLARAIYDNVVARAVERGDLSDVKRAFDEGYFHLSAFMIPGHRSAMLERIRERLDRKERCVVVSTQLVEAGVDVDFPEVYRELAGLDSVVQAAGRCNREGRLPGAGTVRVFELSVDGERQKTETWLEKMKGIARDVVRENGGRVDEGLIPAFFQTRYGSECLDAKGIFQKTATKNLISDRFETMPFEQCALDYRIIQDDSVPVFVPWGAEGRALLKELLASENPAGMAMRLQRFSVGVPIWSIEGYKQADAVEELEPFLILKEDGCRSFYREDVGLVAAGEEVLELLSC
ncbi:CRISPR-associated helicase Cas3' [Gordonibacter urolithinfaciens]|uniref:CRISPR-associated helicase Cas3 n=1 Tax=Gordonibacter urolithinfaciens TaxID=1335613 RepID=A0A7K0I8B3_9ACTN|nr:CRISPR-associated helicase Cas3' [Gordonibacter urolithinfaciens]MSA93760.1 CRISPR-associated helicase Cas3' [Gordonibacter urolithinfaciens]